MGRDAAYNLMRLTFVAVKDGPAGRYVVGRFGGKPALPLSKLGLLTDASDASRAWMNGVANDVESCDRD